MGASAVTEIWNLIFYVNYQFTVRTTTGVIPRHSAAAFFLNGSAPTSFRLFSFFSNNIFTGTNFRLQRDSNSDQQITRPPPLPTMKLPHSLYCSVNVISIYSPCSY